MQTPFSFAPRLLRRNMENSFPRACRTFPAGTSCALHFSEQPAAINYYYIWQMWREARFGRKFYVEFRQDKSAGGRTRCNQSGKLRWFWKLWRGKLTLEDITRRAKRSIGTGNENDFDRWICWSLLEAWLFIKFILLKKLKFIQN